MNADGSGQRVLARFPRASSRPRRRGPRTAGRSPSRASRSAASRFESGLYVVEVDDGEIHRLSRNIDSYPSWSPDGRQIVFQRLTGFHISEITLMDRDGSNQVSLTQGGWVDSTPSWRPLPD